MGSRVEDSVVVVFKLSLLLAVAIELSILLAAVELSLLLAVVVELFLLLTVNFARWEPCHGPFRYGHPWKQYLKIGSLLRQCAYLIDSLIGFLDYTSKTPSETKRKVEEACIQISKETGKSLKELSVSIQKKISPSYAANPSIEKSKIVAMNLKSILKSGLWEGTNIPLMIVIYLLFDVVSCTEKLAESIHELSIQGKFKKKDNKVAPNYPNCPPHLDEPCHGDQEKNIGVHHVITIN
ncbi:aluminum-activated malate transporter 2-like [Arachis ipaensis]|uniref:aluminum-activated malate transporter 2-like n=1 Tax=Arachis ipaensis TaxID=130454 RepID=UPI000A2B39D1|nr:aluminum-activated malate transporter 2-like [Arachis ipaensis]